MPKNQFFKGLGQILATGSPVEAPCASAKLSEMDWSASERMTRCGSMQVLLLMPWVTIRSIRLLRFTLALAFYGAMAHPLLCQITVASVDFFACAAEVRDSLVIVDASMGCDH